MIFVLTNYPGREFWGRKGFLRRGVLGEGGAEFSFNGNLIHYYRPRHAGGWKGENAFGSREQIEDRASNR